VFNSHSIFRRLLGGVITVVLAGAVPAAAQVTPAAGYTPPDDTPAIKVGVTIFADYTINQKPKIKDADGNEVTFSAFQVQRSYINVTGNISHNIAFRVTPDIARETGVGSSLNGSYTFRLKYAYAQWNLDDHMTKGSFARFGMQPNPYFDFFESVYRYRFQGPVFLEREGFLASADVGAVFHYNLPANYGDIQTGFFNGENYNKAEVNNQKAFMFRGTVRPLHVHPVLRGLRFTGYIDKDAYVKSADRTRALFTASFEHPYVNAAFEYLQTKDQTSVTKTALNGRGYSVFVTPKTARGWEGIVRFDHLIPNKDVKSQVRQRTIAGVAYWFPHQGNVSTALLFDVDNLKFDGFSPVTNPTQRKIAVHALVNF
jgi:hypothetical protein